MNEHRRKYDGSDETFDEAKDRAERDIDRLGHSLLNLGPEWVEEKFGLTGKYRQLVGKAVFWGGVIVVVIALGFIGGVIYGVWDA